MKLAGIGCSESWLVFCGGFSPEWGWAAPLIPEGFPRFPGNPNALLQNTVFFFCLEKKR